MAIDPAVLARQRTTAEKAPNLRLVVADTCEECGVTLSNMNRSGRCRRCSNRLWMRQTRALGRFPLAKKGPRLDPVRACPCGTPIAVRNRTGYCAECQRSKFARLRRLFTDGGGI